jgi:hypothetical protein
MPAHLDVLVGEYARAMQTSEAAQLADERIWAAGKVCGYGVGVVCGCTYGISLHGATR